MAKSSKIAQGNLATTGETWDSQRAEARRRFLIALDRVAPEVASDLYHLARAGEVGPAMLADWARRWRLLWQGKPAAWAMRAASHTVSWWQRTGFRATAGDALLFGDAAGRPCLHCEPGRADEDLLNDAEITITIATRYRPTTETPEIAWKRIAMQAEREIARIEALARDRGAVDPITKRDPSHWAQAARAIATGETPKGEHGAGGRKAIRETLLLVELDFPVKRGRPPKKVT